MAAKTVVVPALKVLIQPAPGFAKKGLADFKLDLCALCGFGCRYCSSNCGNYLRINRNRFSRLTEEQLGARVLPGEDPDLMFVWPNVVDQLAGELSRRRPGFGANKTLVFSMLTDGFSPLLVEQGITEEALRLVIDRTEFRVRILTKNAIVGSPRWVDFFHRHSDRFVVGLSIGTTDDGWAKRIERKTSLPTARVRAVRALQDAGVPTFGMLCPVFPDAFDEDRLEQLVTRIRPDRLEHVWAEPYNDCGNWRAVRDGYAPDSFGYQWLTDVYQHDSAGRWSAYAAALYEHLWAHSQGGGWTSKLRYLLYEQGIGEADANRFAGFEGVWLQSKPDHNGLSRNPHIAALQVRPPQRASAK